MTALSALVPDELFTVWSSWAVHFQVLTAILVWVEVPVSGGALVVWVGLPFAVWVNASCVGIVSVLCGLVEIFPEIANSSVDGVSVGVEVQVAFWVALVVSLDSTFALSFVVTRVTFAPRIVVAVAFDHTVVWVALLLAITWIWSCFWIWRGAWISDTADHISPVAGVGRVIVVSSSVRAVARIHVTLGAVPFVRMLPGDARHEFGAVGGVNVIAVFSSGTVVPINLTINVIVIRTFATNLRKLQIFPSVDRSDDVD